MSLGKQLRRPSYLRLLIAGRQVPHLHLYLGRGIYPYVVDLETYPDARPYFEMKILDNMGDSNCFRKENFLLLNLAVGGNFPGIHNIDGITALASGSASMFVDYVRVFQKE